MAKSRERPADRRTSGYFMLFWAIVGLGLVIASFVFAASQREDARIAIGVVLGFGFLIATVLTLIGLTAVEPNMSRVLVLFGNYRGTLKDVGFWWVNPFTVRHKVSLRVRNFHSDTLKVNDYNGNPIEIGAVVVWKVEETAQAVFDVDDYVDYVRIQTESAIRHLAASHPYDRSDEESERPSLRGSADVVNAELREELADRLGLAGIEVLEVRLTHLAYAPEIAGAMLQRQQAEAIIAARTRIVDGAVGMVEMALDNLKDRRVIDLDEERKASMVSNLLVVLCSERGTQPVVNTGTLYG